MTAASPSCDHITQAKSVLEKLGEELQSCGVAGDTQRFKLVYLASVTRLFNRPVSILIKGNSGSGKSEIIRRVLNFLPPSAYVEYSGMSDKALVHSTEDFRHRHIVIHEYAGLQSDTGNKWLRMLISEGRLVYSSAVTTESGEYETKTKTKEGPTGVFMTTTEGALHPEDESRMLSFTIEDDADQTARILRAQASLAAGAPRPPFDYGPWHAFHDTVSAGSKAVVVPYAQVLAGLIDVTVNRVRRDFPQILSLIQAHALIHQANRAHDSDGVVSANLDDYAAVFHLVNDIVAQGVEATVPPMLREVHKAIASVTDGRKGRVGHLDGVAQGILAEKLGVHKATISRLVDVGLRMEVLVDNRERKGNPSQLKIAAPLPCDRRVLPTPQELAAAINGAETREA
jgi:hypothetical protein